MTKVRKRFHLQTALDEALMERIAGAYSIYGIMKIQISPSREDLFVEYDASRLREADVCSALESSGIPVAEVAPV